jgi:hypothetical protein
LQISRIRFSGKLTGTWALSRLDRLRPWLRRLEMAVAVLALVMLFRGQGPPTTWVIVFFALPALRLVVSAADRARVRVWLADLWRQVDRYPADGRTPWRAVLILVAVPALALLSLNDHSIHYGDSAPVMLVAASLVRQGDCELSEYTGEFIGSAYSPKGELPYFLQQTRTGVHSSYPLGMVTFAAPVALLSRMVGGDLDNARTRERLEKWTASWVAAACLCLFFLLALHRVAPLPALIMTALLATGSALYSTVGQALWQHGGVIFFSLAALLLEFRQEQRPTTARTLLQGLSCALMLACRLSSGLFVLALVAWMLVRAPRRAVVLAAWMTAFFVPWAFLYWSIYGSPLGPSSGQLSPACWTPGLVEPLLGVLASPSRGLIVYQPWLLLALAVLLPAVRRHLSGERAACPRGWSLFCVVVVVLHLALVSSWRCWYGGCCWGSRLGSEVVPFCALLLLRPLAALWASRTGRHLILAVGVLSLLLHVPAVHMHSDHRNGVARVDETTEHLWSWTHPPFLFPLQHAVH